MPDLYVHIGTHKTGTTVIQNYLKKHHEKLLNEGINVIKFNQRRETQTIKKYDKSYVESLKKNIDTHVIDNKLNLLSFEGLSGSMATLYSNYKLLADMLAESTQEYNAKIIVFFRRQDQFIQSAYMQMKHQGVNISFDDFYDKSNIKNLDWLRFSEYYSNLFGAKNLMVLPYSPLRFGNESILNVFGKKIGSDTLMKEKNSPVLNVGFSKAAMNVFSDLSKELNQQEKKILRRRLQTQFNSGLFSKYSFLNDIEIRNLRERFSEQNRKLAEKYWDKNYFNFTLQKEDRSNGISTDDIYQQMLMDALKRENDLVSALHSTQGKLNRFESSRTHKLLFSVRNRVNSLRELFNSL